MVCKINCMIAGVFIIATIYMSFMTDKLSIKKNFKDTLSESQKKIYQNIINERRIIYFKGFGIGIVLSFIIILMEYYTKILKLSTDYLACLIASITFLTVYFYYILSKKSDWLILHLNNNKQRKEWLNVYRKMQRNFHLGLVIGIIGVFFLARAFDCK